jgi:hypothetical protein
VKSVETQQHKDARSVNQHGIAPGIVNFANGRNTSKYARCSQKCNKRTKKPNKYRKNNKKKRLKHKQRNRNKEQREDH